MLGRRYSRRRLGGTCSPGKSPKPLASSDSSLRELGIVDRLPGGLSSPACLELGAQATGLRAPSMGLYLLLSEKL